jgi:hypothetical protein
MDLTSRHLTGAVRDHGTNAAVSSPECANLVQVHTHNRKSTVRPSGATGAYSANRQYRVTTRHTQTVSQDSR